MKHQIKKSVLFLCTGNYYRSRFAEVYFDVVASRIGLPWRAISRGLALERGTANVGAMAKEAVRALESHGIRGTEAVTRMPVALTIEDLQAADRIIALLQDEHSPLILERFPDWIEKVEYWQIQDKPGVLPEIEKEVMALVVRIMGGNPTAVEPETPKPIPVSDPPKKLPTVRVGRETAGRRGKGVTTIFDTGLEEESLQKLAATLKQRCGTGGTVKEGRIEIQGDNRDRVVAELEKLGYKVKRVGG